MDVLIVGAGAMGTWFGATVDAEVTFADVDPDAAAVAAERTGGRTADVDGTDRYDAVCVAVPMARVAETIEAHAARADRAILDVSGVMESPLEAMATHAPNRERWSLHPLFAPERSPGSIAVVSDREGSVGESLLADLEAAGNEVFETTATEHDEAMETVQAATHAAVLAFALAVEPAERKFGTPVYDELAELTRTMLGGTPRVYADIQRTFDGADAIADAATAVASADDDTFAALYADASRRWGREPAVGDSGDAESVEGDRDPNEGERANEGDRDSTAREPDSNEGERE